MLTKYSISKGLGFKVYIKKLKKTLYKSTHLGT